MKTNSIYRHLTLFICLGLIIFNSYSSFCQGNGSFDNMKLPLRGAFYYSWYPQTWTVAGAHVIYSPKLGYYSSANDAVIKQHIEEMDYAKIDVAIASWWGKGKQQEDIIFPKLLNKTIEANSKLRWAFYYENEGFSNPTIEELKSDLDYLMKNYTNHKAIARIDNKPVIFVYNANDKTCEVVDRWMQATKGEWYVSLKVISGFKNCANQPDTWHQYGPDSPEQRHNGYSFVISPGFWRADQKAPLLVRDANRWYANVRNMVASGEPWQLVTTFNEWGEGTAIESCNEWQSITKYGTYLDALHSDGNLQTSIKESNTQMKVHFCFYPSQDILSFENTNKVRMLEIFNINGSLVKKLKMQNQDSYNINTNGFGSGVYFIKMSLSSGGMQVDKFVKY